MQSDIFEVNLNLVARDSIAFFPEEVHDCKSALGMNIPQFGVHLRNHDYFMGEFAMLGTSRYASLRMIAILLRIGCQRRPVGPCLSRRLWPVLECF